MRRARRASGKIWSSILLRSEQPRERYQTGPTRSRRSLLRMWNTSRHSTSMGARMSSHRSIMKGGAPLDGHEIILLYM